MINIIIPFGCGFKLKLWKNKQGLIYILWLLLSSGAEICKGTYDFSLRLSWTRILGCWNIFLFKQFNLLPSYPCSCQVINKVVYHFLSSHMINTSKYFNAHTIWDTDKNCSWSVFRAGCYDSKNLLLLSPYCYNSIIFEMLFSMRDLHLYTVMVKYEKFLAALPILSHFSFFSVVYSILLTIFKVAFAD